MAVTIHISEALRQFTGSKGRIRFDVSPATVADALALLWAQYPSVRDRVLTETGDVRPQFNIFVWNESIRYSGGLATPLPEESDVFISPATS